MIIFLGMAGSGKSTQGQILAEKNNWQWISAGQVLRENGNFEELLKTGELADTATIERLMSEKFEEARKNGKKIVLDGHPRNAEQADWLIEHYLDDIEAVIYVEVPKDELVVRIMKRGREDDTPEAVKRRFEIAEQNIYSIISLFNAKNVRVERVNGVGTVEEVTQRIEDVLDNE